MTVCKIPQMALNLNEKKKLQKFLVEHQVYCVDIKKHCNYSIRFGSTTGIGQNTYVHCTKCGKLHDITDYGAW